MKDIYGKNAVPAMLERLEVLRYLDDRAGTHPYYRERARTIYAELANRFLRRMHRTIGTTNVSGISLEEAVLHFVLRKSGNRQLDYISSRIRHACDQMKISYDAYGLSIFCAIFMTARRSRKAALAFFRAAMQPLLGAYRYVKDREKRKGGAGRPPSELKSLILRIANQRREERPDVSAIEAARYAIRQVRQVRPQVKSKLPSAETVRKWIRGG
ncbi:hypothetical protein [Citrobacter cronae]|uniref:hypothetical protein n=1 Tax=Citrobacter cronae TaxID=1748967 RepID=UPI0021CEB03B|nr:hypothetical protein [Citrobacter cronae]